MSMKLRARHEIPASYTWDLQSIFATTADWEDAIVATEAKLKEVTRFKGRLHEGAVVAADWLELLEELVQAAGKIRVYAALSYSTSTDDPAAAAQMDRGRSLAVKVHAALAFSEPELLDIGLQTLTRWQETDPRLKKYDHYFDRLAKQSAHIQSAEIEALLSQLGDPFQTASSTHGILTNTDMTFAPAAGADGAETFPVAQGTIGALLTHADREVRRTAFENYAAPYLTFKNTMANCIAAGVKQNVFNARARGYRSALEAALAPSFLPVEVFHNTIRTFTKHLPTWHRYWRIRRDALGYEKLHPYDLKAPLTATAPVVSFEQAFEWIAASLAPLGEDYVAAMRRGVLEERWVDVYPNQGKRQGAFSSGLKGTHPFIMMSYTDDLFSMSTLSHELGHSMHSYFARQSQPLIYSEYSLFEAEVASNFNQAMTRAYLLAENDERDFQIAVLEEAFANFYRYFFIMPTLARFELEIHERVERGRALTANDLVALLADLFAEVYGSEVEMDRERVGITWAQFPSHLYANFYVFQYTTGISGAHALASSILAGNEERVAGYRQFLRDGGSRYPLDNLRRAGVDMLSPEPVEQTFAVLAQHVDRLEKLVKKA